MSAHVSPVHRFFAAVAAAGLFLTSGPVSAADFYWDPDGTATGNGTDGTGTGGGGTWDTSSLFWWDGISNGAWPNGTADNAIFSYGYVAGPPTENTVNVVSGIQANQISFFRSGYTLSGGDITLAGTTPTLYAQMGETATISSQILGTSGLTKLGGGSIRLTNPSNSYTGTVNIAGGSLIISSEAALGGTGAVNITAGNGTPSNTTLVGLTGGTLVLDGSSAGFTFSRDVNLEGRGATGDRGAALMSYGNNTLSGAIVSASSDQTPATFRNTRITSNNGTLSLTGSVTSQGTAATTFLSLGGVNSAGVGNFDFGGTGTLTGSGSIDKSGGGTLFLNSLASNAGFTGTVRVSGPQTEGSQSSIRVTDLMVGGNNVFGGNTGTNASSAIDLNGGVLEFRNDGDLNFGALSSGKNVYLRASSTVYTGPAVGGDGVNGTTTLGTLRVAANTTGTFNSRNGYGVTLGAWTQESSNNNTTITNNMGGTLLFTGNAWNNSDASNRTLTIGGNGNTIITGSINTSGAGIKTLTKTGSGALTIVGTGTTLNGPVNVQGALVITDFRSIGNNTESITLGNTTTTTGTLVIGTSAAASGTGLKTNRPIVLNGTTASNAIYANQTGANPAELSGAITKPLAGNAGIILGGSNEADNLINSAIPSLGTGGLTKVGSGTWVLGAANLYAGATNIVNGTLKLKANAAVSTILGATSDITFGTSNTFAGGTFEFVGQDGVNNVQSLDVLTTSQGASTVRVTPGAAGTASLTFASQVTGAGGTVNFVGADFVNNKITIVGANGLVSRTNYWEGADFAYRESNVLRAPVYGTDSGFTSSTSALTSGANMEITDSFATNTVSISTLKIVGNQTLTLNSSQTLTLSAGGLLVTSGDAVITGGTALALGSQALVVRTNLSTDSVDIQSVITGSGGLTKGGAGTLILSGINAQTGTISLNEGTIQLSGSGRLGAAAALTMRQGTVLDLNGITQDTNTNNYNNNGSVTSSAPATFTVGGANGTGTSFGTVDGAISLTKIGTGNQSWLGDSTYTGVTTIGSTGLVTVDRLADGGENSGIGASSNAASNLVFNGSTGGLGYAGVIRDNNLTLGSRSATTDRLFTLAGTGARLSSTVSNNNAIVWSNTGAIVHGVTGPQLITFEGTSTGDNTFNPQLTDSGTGTDITSVTKAGTGQWNLGSTNNTYTGITAVQNGILGLNVSGALPSDSPVVLGATTTNGILQMSGTFARNLTTTPAAGTGTITWGGTTGGGGFAAHTSSLTVTLNGGAGLTWGSGGFVGTGGTQSLILSSASALAEVNITNAIDLGAASRTITVNDNVNTGADFAQLSGNLSGAGGGVFKDGAGILRLSGANTYTGLTQVRNGTLVLSSIGNSGDAPNTPTNAGASGVPMDNSNAIELGAGGNNASALVYIGAGETSDRKIRLNSTTGTSSTNQIHANGSGPLILTAVANDLAAGAKSIVLRGNNTDGNMITNAMVDNGGALSVTVDGSATWILSGANTFTGNLTSSAGALGLGSDLAVGAGTLVNSNGNIFAYGADRTIANTLQLNSGASHGFLGDHSLTFTNSVALAASTSSSNFTNNSIVAGKSLIFAGGVNANALTASRNWQFDGPGETVINGDFTSSTTFGVNLIKTGNGTLVLGTNGATSNWNQENNAVDVDRGTLRFSADEAIPSGSATNGGLTISPEIATTDTATVDLNGTTQTVNALTAISNGTLVLDNTSSNAATFRFGANNSTVNFGSGIGSYTVQNTGAGALSLVKLGNTTATFNSGVTLGHKGITASEGGGIFNIAGPVTATSGLRAIGASVLSLSGGLTDPSLITSIEVGGGSTLSLLDGVGSDIANLTTLNLGGSGTGTVTLNLNVGDSNTDMLTLTSGGSLTLGNTVTFNLTDAGLSESTTYTILNLVDGGISAFGIGNMIQGSMPGGFTSMNWTVNNNVVQLTTGTLVVGDLYWRGATDNTWNGALNNWSQDKAGTSPATTLPGQGTNVIFAWDGASGAVTTTLEQNFKVNSLTFESGTTTPTSITIDPGTPATNRLEVAPSSSSAGLTVSTGGPSNVTISTPFKTGAAQTWNVVDSSSILTLSGALQGEADVTKSGSGSVILSAAADPTFNSGQTAVYTVDGGNLEIQNVGSLGTAANSNLASVSISGGAFYYNNATAGTIANPLTLAGGTLSGGGANHTYSGPVAIVSDSTVNLVDSDGPTTNTARNITLSGALSGSGGLTVTSNETTLAGGNAEGGTLTISNNSNTWNGDVTMRSGTIVTTASNGLGGGDILFDQYGRIIVRATNGTTYDLAGTMNFSGGAIGEFSVDNTSGVLGTDFVINQNGGMSLGAGSGVRFSLADVASSLNITGNVVLGGDGSISVEGGDADSFVTISGIISDGGSGFGLNVNDDLGVWGASNTTLRVTANNTFSGNLSVAAGVLEFNTVTNAGGAASSLGQGSAIALGGGNLRFVGSANQSTNRPITTTASSTLSANGTGGAKITYTGAINQATNNSLTLSGTGDGEVTGGITQVGTAADLAVSGGNWTLSGSPSVIADDIIVTNATLNIDGTSLLSYTAGTSNGLYSRNGAVINLLSDDVFGPANSGGLDFINIADTTPGAIARLDTNGFSLSTPGLLVGLTGDGLEGSVEGSGTITVTSTATDWSLGIRLYRGSVEANLAGVATILKQGLGDVTLSGNNSGLTGTVAATRIDSGNLILDYTSQNNNKISAVAALDMRGSVLTLNGNSSGATSQTVASTTFASGGANKIVVNAGTGQEAVLNLGAITRASNSQDGTLRIVLPAGTQSATNGVTTTTNTTNGVLGLSAFATVEDGTGTWFATKSGSNIVALASTPKNDVSTWAAGDHITDETTGFTGTFSSVGINSLRFDAVGGGSISLGSGDVLGIATGGILVTGNVAGNTGIFGGTLFSGAAAASPELIVTHDGSGIFEVSSNIRANTILFKAGAGTMRLSGNNNTSGLVDIQNGTLQVSGGNAIGDSSVVTLADDKASTLELLDDETIGRLQGGNATNGMLNLATVAVGTNSLTINQSGNTTYAGVFTGSGTIVMSGSSGSNLNLTNSSTGFTGQVVVNGGLFQIGGEIARLDASSFTVNKGGTILIDNNGNSSITTRILDTASFVLNSADGNYGGEMVPRGLAIRENDNVTSNETFGTLVINSGANYATLEASGGTSAISSLIAATGWTRNSGATINVRGTNLGNTTGTRTLFKVADANDSTMVAANVGGGGTIGSTNTNVSIVPWAIGETFTGASAADANMGNTLVSYVDNRGFVPLSLTSEYATYSAAGTTDNVRESLSAALTGLSGKTINALVFDNAATASVSMSGSGAGQSLGITSGAMLFTVSGASGNNAYASILDGFDNGITVGGTNEYVIHVVNPGFGTNLAAGSGNGTSFGSTRVTTASTSALQVGMSISGAGIPAGATITAITGATSFEISLPATLSATNQTYRYSNVASLTATISSPLSSNADITKSGRGTLVLSGTNTAGGGANKTTLNEGILEISDLDNIGGNSGALVFAGGTLRAGAGFTDDVSLRSISILDGGATIDSNGVDLVFANSAGSGTGGLTKTGAGTLTLNGASTYTGTTTILGGTLAVGANNATGLGGDLRVGGGATLALGANSVNVGLFSVFGVDPVITGTGTILASKGFEFTNTGDITVGAVLAGTGGLVKRQTNTLTLSGANTYTGITEVQNGILSFDSIANVGGGASALGAPVTVEDGIIRMGLTTAAVSLQYTGTGHSSDRILGLQGSTGTISVFADGTGALGLGGAQFEMAGNKSLVLRGSSDSAIVNTIGEITDSIGLLTINKADANTWMLDSVNSYRGATQVDNGTLLLGVAGALPAATAVRIGNGTTAGTLDTNGFDQTVASLESRSNSASLTNALIIDTGTTFTVTGNVTIGANVAASTTLFSASGGGNFVQTASGGTFQVGGATGSANSNSATADFSALGSMTIDLGATGTFRVGDANTGTVFDPSTLILAPDSTITAGTVRIGDGSGPGSLHTLVLGAGTNVINANTVNVGSAGAAIRSSGQMNFGLADTTGTLKLRAADTSGRAVVNMVNTTGSTATDMSGTIDLSGHDADLLVSTMTMASRTLGANAATATFSFDQGTLDATTLNMASRTSTGTGNATATVNLGDSAAPGSPTTTIGTLNMAVNTSAGGAVTADLNVTGGTVNIGTGSGTAINMANAGTGRTVTSTIDLTGGTVNVTGNIVRTGGAGTENATITLDGAILDLNNNDIGTGAATIDLVAGSGTLRNLNELNGGGNLVKTGAGTLVLEGDNNYTGRTVVNAGILSVSSEDNLGDNPVAFNAAQIELDGGTLQTTATFTIDDANRGITVGAAGGGIQVGTATELTVENAIVLGGDLTKSGEGALYFNGTTSGTGNVLVTEGTFGGNGTISGNTEIQTGATLTGGTIGGIDTLDFNGDLELATGSTWLVDLVETTSGVADQINVGGLLTLGDSELDLALTGTFSGGSYVIANFGTLSGTFNNLAEGDYIGNYQISYGVTTANAITLTAVPEPGTLGLLGLALGGFFFRRSRRRRSVAALQEEGEA